MVRYRQGYDGDVIHPVMKGYKLRCCDCGLVHRIDFYVRRGKVHFQAWRDERATAASRRKKHKEVRPMAKAKLGSGSRFKKVEAAAAKSGAKNPAAVAAAAGIKKYGKKKMEAMAAAGRRRK